MKQIDYLRKSRKNCSALLMACALTFMLLTTTLSFAQTNSLTLGCPTRNGNNYQYAALSLTAGDGVVRSISISFSENPDGCSISLPSTSWTVSGNEYSRYIIPAEGATSAQIQAFLQGVTFNVPNGTLKGVNIILSIDDASRQIFYFAGNGHYYEYVPYDGTKTWTIAYNEAKGKEYCGRPGYLATLTTADEDAFVTRIVQNAMWIGGTRLSPTDNATSTGTQYYADFDTEDQSSPETTDYWYWACGPEKGARITNEGAITNSDDDLDWYTAQPRQPNGYTNWMYQVEHGLFGSTSYSTEPNDNDASHGGESCLTILNLEKDARILGLGNERFSEADLEIDDYVFGWNDVTYGGNNTSSEWRPRGYLVEYGDQSIGHSQTDEACSISASGLVGNATRTVKATLSGDTAVCAGGTATLNITFEGGAYPFTGSVQGNNGEVVHFNTNDISYNFTVTPNETTAYTISAFSDASSTGEAGCEVYTINYTPSGSATVTVNNPQVTLNDIASVDICAGASTDLTATTTGTVTGEVSYAWSTGATGSEITVTPSATTTYTVTATATQGECTATATKSVTVTVNALPTATVSVTDVKCKGAGDGIITVNATGGSGSYQYQLGTGVFQDSSVFTGLNAGSYTLTVKDGNSCTTTTTTTIDEPAQLTLTIASATDETCTGNDGKINYTIAGGTADTAGYTVVLRDSSANLIANQTATGTNTFTGLKAGTYTVTVTDDHDCVATATATIAFKNDFTVRATRDTAICSGATFTINPTASHPAKYSWAAPTATSITGAEAVTDASNISGTLTNTTTSAKSITYTVAAATANGLCTADSFNVVVTVYAPVTGGSIQKDFIVCNGLDSVVTLTNSESGNGGVNGAYIWQSVANDTATTIEGANGETYTPEPIVGTVQYQRVYTTGCGNQPSNAVLVTYYGNVNPGTVVCSNGCDTNYCYGSNINVTLSTSGISVQSGATPTIQWQQSVNGGEWTNIPDSNATTYTYNNANFTEPIKFRYTIKLPSCDSVPSNSVHSIGVWELPVVSIADVATLCPSAASTDITGTIETTTTPNYTYHWSAGSGLTLPTNLPESPTSATSDTIRGTFSTTDCNATYSASLYVVDGHGCTSNTVTKTFTVVDTEVPVISGTLDTINVEGCTVSAAPAAYTTVSELIEAGLNIEDNCGLQDAVTSKQTSTGSCPIVITRTYTVKDLCGDSATVSQTININQADFTMPENAGSTVECATAATAPTTLPVVKDVCGNTLTGVLKSGYPTATPSCEGDVVYVYTFTDCAGHSHDWTYTYTIDRTTAPAEVGGPVATSSTVECAAAATAPTTLPVVKDVCGNTIPAPEPEVGGTYTDCEGTKTYTYTYEDCSGLEYEWTYTYTIDRTTAPAEVGGPVATSSTVECAAAATAPTTLPVVKDVCGNTIPAPEPEVGGTYTDCEGTKTYTYTYEDCSGLEYEWTYTYTIDRTTVPAEVGGPVATSSTVECAAAATAPTTLPVVKDVCGNTIPAPEPEVGGTYTDCEGTKTYTYTYEDCSGLQYVWTYTYTIDRTTVPAEVGTPVETESTVECIADATAPTTLPVVKDVCENTLTAPTPVEGGTYSETNCAGTKTYTYTYKDCAGLEYVWTYTYTIDRTIAPTQVGTPVETESTVQCAADATAPTTLPVVKDVCENTLTAPTPVEGGTYSETNCAGTKTYTYTYKDCAGLEYVWTYTYTIDRTIAPTQVGTPVETESTVECIADATAPTTLPVVKDVCENTLTAPTPVEGGTYSETNCAGTKTYTYTYKDCAGLEYVWTYTYTIDRTIAPTQVGTPVETESTVECIADATAPTTLPVVKDVCGNTLEAPTPVEGGTYTDCEGTKTYTYTYEDCSGLQFVWTYTYTIEHTTAPAEVGGPVAKSSTVECATAATAPTTLPEVKDVCGNTLPAPTPVVGGTYTDCEGTKTYTYTYKDCSGLEYVWTYTYTIDRTTAPAEFGTPVATESTVECIADATAPTILPVVKDVCGNTIPAPTPVEGGTYTDCEGTKTYTYTYKDCAGLQYVWTYTYTIDRTTAPAEVGGPVATSSTVECESAAAAPTTLPVVKDVCGNTLTAPTPVEGGTYTDCEGTKTYTYTYEDCAGLQYVWTYTYTIDRTTAPNEVGGPVATASTVQCIADATAPTTLPVVKDVCGKTLEAPTPVEGGTYTDCEGTKTYTYTYEDCAGLQYVWTYTYTIDRTTAPNEVGGPVATASTVGCIADATAPTTLPVVKDVCGNTLTDPTLVEGGTYTDCEGTKTYTYTYEDCSGLQYVWTYTYTITAPTLTFTGSITDVENVNACYSEEHKAQLLTADQVKAMYSSSCSREISVEISDNVVRSSNCDWMITRTYNISDGGCNTNSQTMSVSGSDQTAPALNGTWPDNITGQDNCFANAVTSGLYTDEQVKALYSDCSTITVTHTDANTLTDDCGWTITRTYTIKDACNNIVTPAPTMSVSGSDQTAPAIGTDDLDSTLTATNCIFTIPDMREIVRNISTDCSEITVTQPSAGMEVYPMVAERDTTVNVIVTDSCGNSSVKEVVITIPAKVTISATATPATICYGATSHLTATPSNVVGTATYNWTPSDGLNNATIANPVATLTTTTTYTVEVTDENGCAATATTTVNVNPEVVMDTVAPMTLCVGDVTSYSFTTPLTVGTMSYAWTNSNTAIGLGASGNGNLPSFTPTNTTNAPINATITVTPSHTYNGITCVGDPINFTITVRPSINTPGNVAFTCPADTTVVLSYSDCEQLVNIGEPEFVNHMSGMTVNITNDAPEGNIFPEGTTVVTWTATDDCGAFLTCTQNVVIQFPPCGDTIADFDGYRYSSVRIGCQCWTGENARSEHYSDGTPVDNFRYYNDSDSLENIYGKLYTWYTAVRVPEGDNNAEPSISTDPFGTTYVQGICPEGWALPTVNEYMLMIANSGDATHAKDGSNLYWLPGYEGQPPFSGFDAYGAGKYNGAIDRYQELLGKTHFWTTLSGSGSETATTVEINYYCAEGLQTELSKGDGVSIRCIRKR